MTSKEWLKADHNIVNFPAKLKVLDMRANAG